MLSRDDRLRAWLPAIFSATAYLTLIGQASSILRDSDTYWHIVVGQWIIDRLAVPHVDLFSYTMRGAPWITSAWLSEVLYFAAFKVAGWTGPVVLAAVSASLAFFLMTLLLLRKLPNLPVAILVTSGIAMTSFHTLARPHVLVFPLMVLWTYELIQASEERRAPSLAYLPLITLWANLHGSFTLALALIAPFGFEAVWSTDNTARMRIAVNWLRFALLAVAAALITPYGPESILVTLRILKLGAALSNIGEWGPLPFGTANAVTISFMAGAAYILFSGFTLPPVRIAVLLALIYQTFVHIRYVDVLALAVPFLVAGPLSRHLSWSRLQQSRKVIPAASRTFISSAAVLIVATGVIVARMEPMPPRTPRLAVERLKNLKLNRVLNDYYFCGYLIFQGIPIFIDSRAELYGSAFLTRYIQAISLEDVAGFVKLLDEYKIDSTLLSPKSLAVGLLDRLPEWERVYADDIAVVHARKSMIGPVSLK
ncbi:hypothetical protein KUL72_14190 [Bradyrhizobium arachidis]|nr:hypothetical protein KUL72_14190 [Bradyrhizobium arachidis]